MICLNATLVRERQNIERIISELGYDRFGVRPSEYWRFGRKEYGIFFERDMSDTSEPKRIVWHPSHCNASEFISRYRPKNMWSLSDTFHITAA